LPARWTALVNITAERTIRTVLHFTFFAQLKNGPGNALIAIVNTRGDTI
jgi:hypothetical protein